MATSWIDIVEEVIDLQKKGKVDFLSVFRGLPNALKMLASAGSGTLVYAIYGVVAALCLFIFVHISGLFPWLGMNTLRSTHVGPVDAGMLELGFGSGRIPAVSGQYILVEYNYRAGTGKKGSLRSGWGGTSPVIHVEWDRNWFESFTWSNRYVLKKGMESGRFAIPITHASIYRIELKSPRMNVNDMGSYASAKWGLSWGKPDASYTIVPAKSHVYLSEYQ